MRALPALVLLLAAATPGPTLGRLADAAAGEVARAAGGRAVELAPPEDRTGAGTLAADLDSLLRSRLERRVPLAASGPRVVVTSVLAQSGPRLVWSARAVEEPGGRLVDLLSASTAWDPALLPLWPFGAAAVEALDVLSRTATPPLDDRVVALALAGEERLLVLSDTALALYRRDGLVLRLADRRELPGPFLRARFPGGLLLLGEGETTCWALTSRVARAALFGFDGGRLSLVEQADAVPWPGAPAGARFRPGTNLLDVSLPGLDTPVLAIDRDSGWAVGTEGTLLRAGGRSAPVAAGPALARLGPALMAAASAEPPGEDDRILVLREGASLAPAGTLKVEGAVRAMAARRQDESIVLVAATEDPDGGFRLVLFEMAERTP